MELEIQKWIRKTKPFTEEALELFNEAIDCYKVGAYKASFMMSYLTYEKTLQGKILGFKGVPSGIEESDWNKTRENIEDEYYWEKNLFDELKKKNGIIKLTDRKYVITKLASYKVTRDACVHGKLKSINASTIEEFWDFLKDNIFKFNVNGGKEYFKEALFKAFRDRNEQLDLTYDDLLESLPFSDLSEDELIEIWSYIDKKINELYGVDDSEIKHFWDKILLNMDEKIQKSFIKYAQRDCLHFMNFYMINNCLLNLSISVSDGVSFKKEILYNWIEAGEPAIYRNEIFWKFIIRILDYIPKEDIKGFFKLLNIEDIRYVPSKEQCNVLKTYEFFNEMKDYLYTELQYDYDKVPSRLKYLDLIMLITKNCLDNKIISMIANYWSKLKYYSKYPKSRDSLCIFEENLLEDKNFMDELIEMVNENNSEFLYNINIEKMIERSKELENF